MKPIAALATCIAISAGHATAEPYRLRGDALAVAPSPAGLLVLDADAGPTDWIDAEALVWMAGNRQADEPSEAAGNALVIAVRAKLLGDRASLRVGRFVATSGALRPVHLDGLSGRARLPYRFDVEAFGGVPVAYGGAAWWDWVAGGRIARRLGDWGAVGVAMLERREEGRLAARELGLDAGGAIGKRTDVAARTAIDLVRAGLAEVAVVGSHRFDEFRVEVRAGQRSPSHLVPATSLFSVLGDVPAQHAGAAVTWRAAPRLDVIADAGARRTDKELAPELTARAVLRLDDRGAGAVGCELRRSGPTGDGWYGARGTARVPLGYGLTASTELELVRPDDDTRGGLWPWGLVALSGRRGGWDGAVAVEASASPEYRHRVDVLAQLGRRWNVP